MEKAGKYNKAKLIGSAIATAVGILLVGLKTYSYIGIILLSVGGAILALSLQARKKEIVSDELTEWVEGKSAVLAFWATWSTIVLLLAIDLYRPDFIETYMALGIVMVAAVGAMFFGVYYYGKIKRNIGF
ncbi:MAG: DUF2178 domain-containing protein [Candidatus Methanoperedens sp.]|nr:DUF2178 domain-containing protein [Candidatus Methanoperedens sp.]